MSLAARRLSPKPAAEAGLEFLAAFATGLGDKSVRTSSSYAAY